ncbi:MAG: cache domain-containing protein [Thermodesulfobacteriota bacterium]
MYSNRTYRIPLRRRPFLCLFLALLFACQAPVAPREKSYAEYKESRYLHLDAAIQSMKGKLISYVSDVQTKANQITQDAFVTDFFKIIMAFQALKGTGQLTPQAIRNTELLEKKFNEHYILHYQGFYDILFINPQGDVFFTIRRQNDLQKNIFNGQLKDTALSKKMTAAPAESFVDFQFYEISGEPSAFFIEPVQDNNGFQGWIVLQFAVTKINDLFSQEQDIGATGEIFLVNREHYMLTDSRFNAESTILKEHLPDENISSKFAAGKGRKEVVDYRGKRVASSFETFDFLDSRWLIIAKMDEAEIFTDYFRQYPEKLRQAMDRLNLNQPSGHEPVEFGFDDGLEVDMDEFRRTDQPRTLYTYGVSTCAAFVLKYPGKFTYLAHISTYDKVYGENRTDLIAHILKKVEYLEIKAAEKNDLEFCMVSPSRKAFYNMVGRLLEHGYFLSQIRLMQNPDAAHANVKSEELGGEVLVNWKMKDNTYYLDRASKNPSLQERLKQAM